MDAGCAAAIECKRLSPRYRIELLQPIFEDNQHHTGRIHNLTSPGKTSGQLHMRLTQSWATIAEPSIPGDWRNKFVISPTIYGTVTCSGSSAGIS